MFYLLNTKSIIIHYLILYIQARKGAPCTVATALSLSLDLSTFAQLSARLRLRNAVHEVKCVRGGETSEEALTNCRWHCRAATTTTVQIEREEYEERETRLFMSLGALWELAGNKRANERCAGVAVSLASLASLRLRAARLTGHICRALCIVNCEWKWMGITTAEVLGLPVANWGYGKDLRINGLALSAFSC